MSLVDFAKAELKAAGFDKPDSLYDGMLYDTVLHLIQVFAKQGHSGASAAITVSLFNKLARFEPIRPLTGTDDEWTEVMDGCWQNKRCSSVFKDKHGAYDSQGRVFREVPGGVTFTNSYSRVPVTFPYTPKVEIVDVHKQED